MKIKHLSFLLFLAIIYFLTSCGSKKYISLNEPDPNHPKREFRGAWIHTIGQGQYAQMNSEQMKTYFVDMLDKLQAVGINAVIFQVRPTADAFYRSSLEPWSRYLSGGVQGVAPDNGFDPLAFMVEECHKRNMELHAWLNPYRVKSSLSQTLAANHIYNKHPERFVTYGNQMYFDPGIPENRDFICQVVKDILLHYNVDAIHFDDYFYPYPISGTQFPDDASFNRYAAAQGFSSTQRADWRRNNVNLLIKDVRQTILKTKPWVRFGISPFGIYRNKCNTLDASGSETKGLQCYDDLYADIKLWLKNGWIDYDIPQLYWQIGHPVADYTKLIAWWANNNCGQHLYIGQDVKRTLDKTNSNGESQLKEKMNLEHSYPTISGNCFWSGYLLIDNYKNIDNQLINNYFKYPALIPAYTNLYAKCPHKVKKLKEVFTPKNHILMWQADNVDKSDPTHAQYFVVYRFKMGESVDLRYAKNIVKITNKSAVTLPYEGSKNTYKYVVTAIDAFHNESEGKSIKIKL